MFGVNASRASLVGPRTEGPIHPVVGGFRRSGGHSHPVVHPSFVPLTPLTYGLLTTHPIIFMIGGHYTNAEVPLGFWMENLLDLGSNHYDCLGHFTKEGVPSILTLEISLM